jgi:hypothetical protein
MAVKIKPSQKYLEKFSSPLWDLLDLEQCKPLLIVEGKRDGYRFIVINMEHDEYRLFRSDQGVKAVSTFFMVQVPRANGERCIVERPAAYEASVDEDFVYLARPCTKFIPSEWGEILKKTMQMAASLKAGSNDKSSLPTYRPVGGGAFFYAFAAAMSLLASIVFLIFGIGSLLDLIHPSNTRSESLQYGWASLFCAVFMGIAFLQNQHKFQKRR